MPSVQDALTRAVASIDRGDLQSAEEIGQRILRDDPHCTRALHVLGVVARKMERPELAVRFLHAAIATPGDDAAIQCELGLALLDTKKLPEALVHFRRAAEINPDYGDAHLNIGATLDRFGQPEMALPHCKRAVELLPENKFALFNLGNVWRSLRQLDRASHAFTDATRIDPQFANAYWNDACCRLLAGDFAKGWRQYEWRELAGEVQIDRYPQPRWQGESLSGKSILVHAEQGIGDEILFASCLPDLIARAGQCNAICDPRLSEIFARSFPTAKIYGISRRKDRQGAAVAESADYQIAAGSVPLYLRSSRDAFPMQPSFLKADAKKVLRWRNRFAELGPGMKIGISWRAGGQPLQRHMRTTTLGAWREILTTPGAQFVNLQYGDSADELAAAERQHGVKIHDGSDADPLIDMDAFAAKIAALDLVISVGNATVHLAGALGVKTWTLLPQVPGWRWMIAGDESIWYRSVRLFRQTDRGDWTAVFDRVGKLLRETIAANPVKSAEHRPPRGWTDIPSRPTAPELDLDMAAEFQQAAAAASREELAQAEAICRRILDHVPRHVPALSLLAQIARQTGRLDLAIRSLTRAVAAADRDSLLCMNLAILQHEGGQIAEAMQNYRRAIAIDPGSTDAHFGLAKALHAAGRLDDAIAMLQSVVRLRPDHHKALNFLGGYCLAASRLEEAEHALRTAVRLQPEYMAAFNNLGMVLERQQRLPEALACFDRAVELDETCHQALNNLVGVLERLGQRSAAELVRRRAGEIAAR